MNFPSMVYSLMETARRLFRSGSVNIMISPVGCSGSLAKLADTHFCKRHFAVDLAPACYMLAMYLLIGGMGFMSYQIGVKNLASDGWHE